MKKISSLLTPLAFLLTTSPVFAQDASGIVGTIQAPSTVISAPSDTGSFITVIVVFITVIAGLYALWQFLTGGFGYISSGGDKAKVQQSTQQIFMAILGLVTIGASFIIGSLIGRLLFGPNFDLFAPVLKSVS